MSPRVAGPDTDTMLRLDDTERGAGLRKVRVLVGPEHGGAWQERCRRGVHVCALYRWPHEPKVDGGTRHDWRCLDCHVEVDVFGVWEDAEGAG